MGAYAGRQGGPLSGDFDGIGPSTIDLVSSGASMGRAAAVSQRTVLSAQLDGLALPWGSVGVGLVTLIVALLYLDGRILR